MFTIADGYHHDIAYHCAVSCAEIMVFRQLFDAQTGPTILFWGQLGFHNRQQSSSARASPPLPSLTRELAYSNAIGQILLHARGGADAGAQQREDNAWRSNEVKELTSMHMRELRNLKDILLKRGQVSDKDMDHKFVVINNELDSLRGFVELLFNLAFPSMLARWQQTSKYMFRFPFELQDLSNAIKGVKLVNHIAISSKAFSETTAQSEDRQTILAFDSALSLWAGQVKTAGHATGRERIESLPPLLSVMFHLANLVEWAFKYQPQDSADYPLLQLMVRLIFACEPDVNWKTGSAHGRAQNATTNVSAAKQVMPRSAAPHRDAHFFLKKKIAVNELVRVLCPQEDHLFKRFVRLGRAENGLAEVEKNIHEYARIRSELSEIRPTQRFRAWFAGEHGLSLGQQQRYGMEHAQQWRVRWI
ncbi:hypothetical protein ACM66B_006064 [Microbotryomycetes sp. NB124-2]